MGSVISDVVTDIARFPYMMVDGNAHQTFSATSEAQHEPTAFSRSYQRSSSSSHQRQPSSSATPTLGNPGSSSFTNYNQPRRSPNTTPTAPPPSYESSQNNIEPNHTRAVPTGPPQVQVSTAPDSQAPEAPYGYDQSGFPLSSEPAGLGSSPPSPRLQPTLRSSVSLSGSGPASPSRIKVRDLNHIQSFASEEVLTRSRHGSRRSLRGRMDGQQYEISAMPVTDIIEMVAGLLTKITTTNDRQHEHMHRNIPPPEGTSGLSQQTTSVLAFHGKNVPSITILSYLSRIHKYCPTTYEVFLSLLVYFDRMTEMVNSGTLHSFQGLGEPNHNESRPRAGADSLHSEASTLASEYSGSAMVATPPSSASFDVHDPYGVPQSPNTPSAPSSETDLESLSHFFVVDSFNIHRLVIAGVTCASKFFSDVFYTNSRYAKVSELHLKAFGED